MSRMNGTDDGRKDFAQALLRIPNFDHNRWRIARIKYLRTGVQLRVIEDVSEIERLSALHLLCDVNGMLPTMDELINKFRRDPDNASQDRKDSATCRGCKEMLKDGPNDEGWVEIWLIHKIECEPLQKLLKREEPRSAKPFARLHQRNATYETQRNKLLAHPHVKVIDGYRVFCDPCKMFFIVWELKSYHWERHCKRKRHKKFLSMQAKESMKAIDGDDAVPWNIASAGQKRLRSLESDSQLSSKSPRQENDSGPSVYPTSSTRRLENNVDANVPSGIERRSTLARPHTNMSGIFAQSNQGIGNHEVFRQSYTPDRHREESNVGIIGLVIQALARNTVRMALARSTESAANNMDLGGGLEKRIQATKAKPTTTPFADITWHTNNVGQADLGSPLQTYALAPAKNSASTPKESTSSGEIRSQAQVPNNSVEASVVFHEEDTVDPPSTTSDTEIPGPQERTGVNSRQISTFFSQVESGNPERNEAPESALRRITLSSNLKASMGGAQRTGPNATTLGKPSAVPRAPTEVRPAVEESFFQSVTNLPSSSLNTVEGGTRPRSVPLELQNGASFAPQQALVIGDSAGTVTGLKNAENKDQHVSNDSLRKTIDHTKRKCEGFAGSGVGN